MPRFYFIFISTASSFEELVSSFQLALFRHYNNGGAPLFQPSEMEEFSPTLFNQVLKSICNTNSVPTKDRVETQRKRTVAILHILAYFRYFTFKVTCKPLNNVLVKMHFHILFQVLPISRGFLLSALLLTTHNKVIHFLQQ